MTWMDVRVAAFVVSPAGPDLASAAGGGVAALGGDPLALAEELASAPRERPVLLAGTCAQRPLLRRQATFAVARWPDLRVSWRAVPAAALAVAHAAGVAARADLPPTLAVHLFDLVIERSWSCAWVPSVARLNEPEPSLRQHLRSVLPGPGFVVLHQPRPRVVPVGAIGAAPLAAERRGVLMVGGDVPPEVMSRVIAESGTSEPRRVAAVVDARAEYGTAHAVELAAPPAVPDHDAVAPTGACPSCSSPLAAPACPFCHAAAVVDPARRAV